MRNYQDPKMAYERKLEKTRKPRKKQSEDVEGDIREMKVRRRKRKAQDRDE